VATVLVYLVAILAMIVLLFVAYRALVKPFPTQPSAPAVLPTTSAPKPLTLEDALEAWLKRFDERNIEMRKQLHPPASAQQIARLEKKTGIKLPDDLRALYLIADGQQRTYVATKPTDPPNASSLPFPVANNAYVGCLFGDHTFLSTLQAEKEWEEWRLVYSNSSRAERDELDNRIQVRSGDPVRKHNANVRWLPFAEHGGNAYAVDLDPAPGGQHGQIIAIDVYQNSRRVLAPSLADFLAAAAQRGFAKDYDDSNSRFYFSMEMNEQVKAAKSTEVLPV
jgi:cell wall assembly regulator SMI1